MITDDAPGATIYDRRAFALAYVEAQADYRRGYYSENSGYNAALRTHRRQILTGLQELFGLTLARSAIPDDHQALFMLFDSTVTSYLTLATPWSRYLEAGLVVRRLDEAGRPGLAIREASDRVGNLTERSREAHLDILEALLEVFLGERAPRVFSSADLRSIGVDDTPPNSDDYPWDTDE